LAESAAPTTDWFPPALLDRLGPVAVTAFLLFAGLALLRSLLSWLLPRTRPAALVLALVRWLQVGLLGVLGCAGLLLMVICSPGFWSLVLLALAVAVLLSLTVLGRYCYAIGSNEATARLCGVAIARNKLAIYLLAGLLTGWAGVLSFAHVGSGDPASSQGLELLVIAAVVIGGARLSGGQGTVLGTLLGVLIL